MENRSVLLGFGFAIATGFMAHSGSAIESCPAEPKQLVDQLLGDLPQYANRAIAQTQPRSSGQGRFIVTASQPEFTPWLGQESITQVYFTTLEHQYHNQEQIKQQSFHRLLLTQDGPDWYLVGLYSRMGTDLLAGSIPSAPQEASNSALGQGIQRWLRDCRFVAAGDSP
ncbi:MAG: hypothetical protein AAGG02_06010 [Cyanobacteria bacterium P01_H01_bin.15]